MTDNDRPKPHPRPAKGSVNCPYWTPDGTREKFQAHVASTAAFLAALEAADETRIEDFRVLCETAEPRDYATVVYIFADLLNEIGTKFGVDPHATMKVMRRRIDDALADTSRTQ